LRGGALITFTSKGSFKNTEAFLRRAKKSEVKAVLDKYGQEGVNALALATPTDSGETAHSWTYEITHKPGRYAIVFRNTHVVNGTPVAILIQYGHATRTGGYVEGRDYINPVIRPLFDKIANDVWKAVTG
jgi:hypothetical protein